MAIVRQRPFNIVMIGIVQILVALYSFYIFYLKLKLKSMPLINVMVSVYIVHLFISAISILKLENPGRILSITNLLGFAIFSLAGIFLGGRSRLIFCIIFFIISIYFVYFLTRPNVKQFFENKAMIGQRIFKKKEEVKVISANSFSKKLAFVFILLGNFLYLLTFYSVTGYINIFAIILLLIIDFAVIVFIRKIRRS